jgi:hypothetical protein
MAQQTAVEWLATYLKGITSLNCDDIIERAKAMEKEQMIDAHIEGQRVFDNYKHTQWTTDQAEQYYDKTFKLEVK